jgi:hypothetical protein
MLIREHFRIILWIALGQQANLDSCQELMYTQLTGKDLPADADQDSRRETIARAMRGQDILLVLVRKFHSVWISLALNRMVVYQDDLWDVELVQWFCFLDQSTKSRVLMSSRVLGALSGCVIIDIGLPSEADAIRMVMAAADLATDSVEPPGAKDVVRLCKSLPLTLGIAGRTIKDMALGPDWSDAVELMQEELGSEARSVEDSIIATSLRALKGPQQEHVRTLLKSFALVPEDVKIPLEMMCWVFEAEVGDGSAPPSLIALRRWTKHLIDRSLCLGPLESPQLHDIVLDFCIGQHSGEELREAHRRLVNTFRDRRPTHVFGRPGTRGWDSSIEDRRSRYVVQHCYHHIREACGEGGAEIISWLDDFTMLQDIIPVATASILGPVKCSQLAQQAESDGDWWKAALRWSASALHKGKESVSKSTPLLKSCMAALAEAQPIGQAERENYGILEFFACQKLLLAWDTTDMATYQPRMLSLIESGICDQDPCAGFVGRFLTVVYSGFATLDKVQWAKACLRQYDETLRAASTFERGHPVRVLMLAMLFGNLNRIALFKCAALPEFEWDAVLGQNGCLLTEVSECYSFDTMHERCDNAVSWDGMSVEAATSFPLLLHWGDVQGANANLDRTLSSMQKFIAITGAEPSGLGTLIGALALPCALVVLGRAEVAADLMRKMNLDPPNLDATMAKLVDVLPALSAMVPLPMGVIFSVADMCVSLKSLWVLANDVAAVDADEFADSLPAPLSLAQTGMVKISQDSKPWYHGHWVSLSSHLWPALACEKLGLVDMAVAYANHASSDDLSNGGHFERWQHSLAHQCSGRCHASRNRMVEASAAFEDAIEAARDEQCWLLEAVALRELRAHVLQPLGRAHEAQGRLCTVMTKLRVTEEEELDTILRCMK